ncbi:MAG: hypothetical protein KDD40_03975, partial [Bdellovibrionales bacterium]|nr:hypothetical protein [Bdellovibrionales bacterium]
AEDLKEVILTGHMKREIARGFCGLFVRQVFLGSSKKSFSENLSLGEIVKKVGDASGMLFFTREKSDAIDKLKMACMDHENDSEYPSFIVDRKIRVHGLKGAKPVFRGGKQMNFNVGGATSYHRDKRFAFTRGFNGAAAGRFFPGIINDVTGLIKMGVDVADSKSKSTSTTIQKAAFLVMQSAAFDIKLTDYEYCAVIRWNPEIFNNNSALTNLIGVLNNEGKNVFIPGGYFLCAGKDPAAKPVFIREHYYYFTQHFTDGDMLDSGDLYNHPWLLSLRGARDGAAFVYNVSHKQDYQMTELSKGSHDHAFWPIKKMIETYLNVTPSFPGLYSLIGEAGDKNPYGPDYPWNEDPETAFKRIQEETLESQFGRSVLGLPDFSQMKNFVEEQEKTYIPDKQIEGRGELIQQFPEGGNPNLNY